MAGMGSAHTKKPELPTSLVLTWNQSNSAMKFSYCLAVRRNPVGLPVVIIISSLTKKVSGWQFTLTQPVRSLPLNIWTKPSSFFSSASSGDGKKQR